jgi:hypothetical protein
MAKSDAWSSMTAMSLNFSHGKKWCLEFNDCNVTCKWYHCMQHFCCQCAFPTKYNCRYVDNSSVSSSSSILETNDALTWFDNSDLYLLNSTLVTGSGKASVSALSPSFRVPMWARVCYFLNCLVWCCWLSGQQSKCLLGAYVHGLWTLISNI